MTKKEFWTLAVVVIVVVLAWRRWGRASPATLPTAKTVVPSATPRNSQPSQGAQPLQQSPAPSNLATLAPPDTFGPMGPGSIDTP